MITVIFCIGSVWCSWIVCAQCAPGYVGGNTPFHDVVKTAAGDLFCAATPNPDASQVQDYT